ncbi:unnamed protein product [Durusdinium trenchii]|uniref:Cyclic nucleotide-binding domain-containing protein n=1 Tax=Durusdinium trenchii TaxID=1381693 RepID=A0ABP0NJ79_9DINO
MGVIKALNVLGTLTAAVARSRSLRTTQLHWPSPPRKVREVRDAPKKCNALAIAQLGSALLQQTGLCSYEFVEAIMLHIRKILLHPEKVLVKEEDNVPRSMYFVLFGNLDLFRLGKFIGTISSGQVIGEGVLLGILDRLTGVRVSGESPNQRQLELHGGGEELLHVGGDHLQSEYFDALSASELQGGLQVCFQNIGASCQLGRCRDPATVGNPATSVLSQTGDAELEPQELRRSLRRMPCLRQASEEFLEALEQGLVHQLYFAEQCIVNEGQDSNFAAFLGDGEVTIEAQGTELTAQALLKHGRAEALLSWYFSENWKQAAGRQVRREEVPFVEMCFTMAGEADQGNLRFATVDSEDSPRASMVARRMSRVKRKSTGEILALRSGQGIPGGVRHRTALNRLCLDRGKRLFDQPDAPGEGVDVESLISMTNKVRAEAMIAEAVADGLTPGYDINTLPETGIFGEEIAQRGPRAARGGSCYALSPREECLLGLGMASTTVRASKLSIVALLYRPVFEKLLQEFPLERKSLKRFQLGPFPKPNFRDRGNCRCSRRVGVNEESSSGDLPICQHVDLSHELLDFFGQHVERRIFFPGDRRRVCGGRSDGSDGRDYIEPESLQLFLPKHLLNPVVNITYAIATWSEAEVAFVQSPAASSKVQVGHVRVMTPPGLELAPFGHLSSGDILGPGSILPGSWFWSSVKVQALQVLPLLVRESSNPNAAQQVPRSSERVRATGAVENTGVVAKVLRERSIFAHASQEFLAEILNYGSVRVFMPGDRIIQQGAEGNSMFILSLGLAQVVKENLDYAGNSVVRSGSGAGNLYFIGGLTYGSVFGELVMLGVQAAAGGHIGQLQLANVVQSQAAQWAPVDLGKQWEEVVLARTEGQVFRERLGFVVLCIIGAYCSMRILVELRSILEPFLWALFLVMAWKPVVDGIESRLEVLLAFIFPSLRTDSPRERGRKGHESEDEMEDLEGELESMLPPQSDSSPMIPEVFPQKLRRSYDVDEETWSGGSRLRRTLARGLAVLSAVPSGWCSNGVGEASACTYQRMWTTEGFLAADVDMPSTIISAITELPSCDFFPRRDYAVASFSSGDGFVVLGGSAGHVQLNDLWSAKLLGRGAAATWHWTEVSPHLDGRRDPMDGQLLLSKWPGRSRLATAVALAPKSSNARAIYVTGGQGAYCFEDFWASEDGGQTWYCMCRKVPWGGRLDPGLCVVPTKYEQLVLLGGIVPGIHLRVECDVWISSDAGSTWQPLRAPDWEPRCCPLLFFMPPQDGQRQLLVLGGARLAEASAGDRAHAIGPRCLDDAWSLQVDFDEGTGTFEPLHSDVDREVEVSSDSTHSAVK